MRKTLRIYTHNSLEFDWLLENDSKLDYYLRIAKLMNVSFVIVDSVMNRLYGLNA